MEERPEGLSDDGKEVKKYIIYPSGVIAGSYWFPWIELAFFGNTSYIKEAKSVISKVEISSVNTSKLPVLTQKEKEELLVEIKNGNKEAREKFIKGNLRLVLSVIQRFGGRRENADDLFQVGCVGLIKAIDNFDITLNVQFSTYAVPMIIGEIRRYLRDNNMVRVSRSVRDLAYRVIQYKEQATKENKKEPKLNKMFFVKRFN